MDELVAIVQDERFHFSGVLIALADYCNSESGKIPEATQTWNTVATLLMAAAQEAETEGRQLP
jgi:hypothetical protein